MSDLPNSAQENSSTVLIFDKEGTLGEKLSRKLIHKHLVVFISSQINPEFKNENLIKIHLGRKIPKIPDNSYSHIFVFDDGTAGFRNTISPFLQKSQLDKSPLVFVSSVRILDQKFYEKALDSPNRVKLAIVGDVFGKDRIYDEHSVIGRFVDEAKQRGRIKIEGQGLNYSMPVYDDDVVDRLLDLGMGDASEKIFYIFPDHPVSDISLSRMFKKIHPDISIDFTKDGKEREYFLPEGGAFVLDSNYRLVDRIKEIRLSPEDQMRKPVIQKNRPRFYSFKTFWVFSTLLFIVFLPLLSTGFYSFLGVYSLNFAKQNIEKGDLENASRDARRGVSFFKIANKSAGILTSEASLIGLGEKAEGVFSRVETGREVSEAALSLIEAGIRLQKIYSEKSDSVKEEFRDSQRLLKSAVLVFRKIEAEKIQGFEFLREIKKIEPLMEMFVAGEPVSEDLLGFTDEKKYLILFQNNMELRPGGGFIGSYGILRIKNAKVLDFSIHDVYSADGQLKAHVEPPFPIRRYLPSVNWYLRDSNFDIDFPTNARNAAYLLSLETSEKLDGVIAFDVSFIKEILETVGSVEVTDYKETVNSGNFYTLTQKYVERDFFPGSTQKKDFLNSLYKSIQRSFETKKNINYFGLLQKVSEGILGKHLMLTFENVGASKIFSTNGWSGSILDNRRQESGVFNDFLGVSEANLGVNKANFFVSRRVYYSLSIDKDRGVTSEAEIVIDNKSSGASGGDYENYIRFILPEAASLEKVKIDGKETPTKDAITNPSIYEAKNFNPGSELEVESSIQHGKRVIGFITNIPKGKKRTISITYSLPKASFDEGRMDYSLMFYKQPGTEDTPVTVRLNYPDNMRLIETEGGVEKGKVIFSDFAKSDLIFTSSFARN